MWKTVKIEVSDDGRARFMNGEMLSVGSGTRGYANVRVGLHRLIAWAFHGPPTRHKMVVDHIDGDVANNRPENLRWLTQSENCKNHSHKFRKLNDQQVAEIKSLRPGTFETQPQLAARLGISTSYVRAIRGGRIPARSRKGLTQDMIDEILEWSPPRPTAPEVGRRYHVSATSVRSIWSREH